MTMATVAPEATKHQHLIRTVLPIVVVVTRRVRLLGLQLQPIGSELEPGLWAVGLLRRDIGRG